MNSAASRRRLDYGDSAAVTVLVAVALWLFRGHLAGRLTFLGNPDRLNANLKVLKFYADGLHERQLHAWNPAELLGYDAFAQPYTFPNPLAFLTAAFGAENVYVTAGFVSCLLLASAGIAAYAFARQALVSRGCALLAAVLYQCSAISILKVSQNDMSYMVIVLVPIIALIIRLASPKKLASTYVMGTVVFYVLLEFCFLQKVAYALIFAGAYATYRAYEQKSLAIPAIVGAAVLTALVGASPRIYGLAQAMGEYVRIQPDESIATFSDLFRYQGVMPYQILRWFEDGMLGRHFADQTAVLNGINLSEGFLLYTSPMLPLVVLAAAFSLHRSWDGFLVGRPTENRFFLWFLLLTIAVALIEAVNYLMHLLFLKVDFVHARFLVAGLLPMVVYAASFLDRSQPTHGQTSWRRIALAVVCGIAAVAVVEIIADRFQGTWTLDDLWDRALNARATARAVAGLAVSAAFLVAAMALRQSAEGRQVLLQGLVVAIGLQAVLAANYRLNGAHTRNGETPFLSGDIYFATRDHFRIPPSDRKAELHADLERDKFRSVMICNPKSAGGFCAAHIAQYWELRLADGYYGIGVPGRLAALPWSSGLGLRHIVFTSEQQLPWRLLGFLNVKYAVQSNDYLYRYVERGGNSVRKIANPAAVVPRAFFASSAVGAKDMSEAKTLLFGGPAFPEPERRSVVEGLRDSRSFAATEDHVTVEDGPDRIDLTFRPASVERLLVVNELFSPRWQARVDGQDVPIHPTNLVMRGVLVPPNATRVTMQYRSAANLQATLLAFTLAMLIGVVCAAVLHRRQSSFQTA